MRIRLFKFAPFVAVLVCSIAHARSTPQRVWKLPILSSFEGLSERPGNRLGIYWSGRYIRYTTLDGSGKLLATGEVPGQRYVGNGISREDWNVRGQHAYLPDRYADITDYIRLKEGNSYRVLRFLPRFKEETLHDLRFSPDGECLYVLGREKLWIVGAQSGRLLRIIKPQDRKTWSDENAALSSDCRRILAMRGKMALYSTRSGQLLRRFGTKVETFTGHCGSLEAEVFFTPDGQYAVARMQDAGDYETWVYPASGGALCWHGRTPYTRVSTARGHLFLDTVDIDEYGGVTTVLRRWRDGKVAWHLKLNFDYTDVHIDPRLIFSRDGRWIYFARDKNVWRVAMPKLS